MESCCICLEQPQPDNSLHLISCGCQGAWFHEPCQSMWLLSTGKLTCPICRRDIPFQITYDFSHPILRLINFLYVLELFMYSTVPVLQGTALLAFPCILPCSKDFLFFATHYSIHSILDMFIISEKEQVFFRYLHLIILAIYINHKKRVDPFTQFVIGRSIIYSKKLEYSTALVATQDAPVGATQDAPVGAAQDVPVGAAQDAPNALEGDKPRRSGRRRR